MSNRYDILLDDELQLQEDASTHDWVEGESTAQHQQLLLLTPKGSWKETPGAGVGMMNYLESESDNELLAEIARQFRADGMDVATLGIDQQKLVIDAKYR